LAEDGQPGRAIGYAALSVVVSLAAVVLGMRLARVLLALRGA
jgi:fluoride ion exporter CrcB/FEX